MTSLDPTPRNDAPAVGPVQPDGPARAEVEAATAANLLAGLANRLRSAYEEGAELTELADACHQPLPTVRRLLEEAGVELVPEQRQPPAIETRQFRRFRRPTPSRRLSRIHASDPEEAEPTGPAVPPSPVKSLESPDSVPAAERQAAQGETGTPMGILIGASPGLAEPTTQVRAERSQRVAARLVRAGRGTSLVVLPEWRSAIAVSVPTEELLASTRLEFEDLPRARLSVVINPEALHDRELDPRDWRAESRRR